MKKLILILALSVGAFFGWEHQDELLFMIGSFEQPEDAKSVKKPLRTQNLKWLYRQNKELNDLSEKGSYTVVFVTSPDCESCASQLNKLQAFTKKRRDVVVYKVSSDLNPKVITEPGGLQDHQARYMKSVFEAYEMDRTPHVEVYGPNGELMASDKGESNSGTRYFKKWIEVELKKRY
jgi:hypothetical protein